jgi:hypothetical protein
LVNAKRQVLMCQCPFSWCRCHTVCHSRCHAFRRCWMVEWDAIERVEVNLNEFERIWKLNVSKNRSIWKRKQEKHLLRRDKCLFSRPLSNSGNISMSSAGCINLWLSKSTRFYMCPT